jgi:hypothetical protein
VTRVRRKQAGSFRRSRALNDNPNMGTRDRVAIRFFARAPEGALRPSSVRRQRRLGPPARALLLLGLASTGCGDDKKPDSDEPEVDRFVAAAELEASWCSYAQRIVAGYDDTTLPDSKVQQVDSASLNDFVSSRADVKDGVLQVQALSVPYAKPSESGPAELTRMVACKLRAPEAIESLLGAKALGATQACEAVHEAAWDWALSQLTDEERQRYDDSGHKLMLGGDLANTAGPQWIASEPRLTAVGADFSLASSALVSPGTDFTDGTQGAVYCKLWSPAHMLYWLLVRAYESEPLAAEPKPADPMQTECMPLAPHVGSCTFLFEVASSHFCEDYTGSKWTSENTQAKCTMRGGTYSTEPCSNRKAETDTFDGDGVFKGQCVLKCGTPDEYVWNTYSGTGDGSGCASGSWLPATAAP